jgi:hypothetical protein
MLFKAQGKNLVLFLFNLVKKYVCIGLGIHSLQHGLLF